MSQINQILYQKISDNAAKIEQFFEEKLAQYRPNFYNSIDLRHFGFKIAPIDTNCFPAGFNNFSLNSINNAKKIVDNFFKKNFSHAKNIIIIPENHTRNLRYLENLANLQEILSAPNRQVIIASTSSEITQETTLSLEKSKTLTIYPITTKSGEIRVSNNIKADLAILNNDFTNGIPDILKNITTPIIPSSNLGWHKRTKSQHFDIYNKLATELCQILDIDPWLISTMHSSCHDVNFKEKKGFECLAKYVDNMIAILKQKYQKYGIEEQPYCYVKSDNGTYGMAVWQVHSGQEILQINKKDRNKMNMLKGSILNTQVMIQEGVPTIDTIDNKIAEPLIYLINGQIAANLFRVNDSRNQKNSLNAANASFYDLQDLENNQIEIGLSKDKITKIYQLIAQLAALASAIENSQNKL